MALLLLLPLQVLIVVVAAVVVILVAVPTGSLVLLVDTILAIIFCLPCFIVFSFALSLLLVAFEPSNLPCITQSR